MGCIRVKIFLTGSKYDWYNLHLMSCAIFCQKADSKLKFSINGYFQCHLPTLGFHVISFLGVHFRSAIET